MRVLLACVLMFGLVSCKKADDVYLACESADECTAPEDMDPVCLDKSGDGFCSWECADDAACEEADDGDFSFVCASFESEVETYCFPACDTEADAEEECPRGFGCRSTGGGNDNRKVCFPEA